MDDDEAEQLRLMKLMVHSFTVTMKEPAPVIPPVTRLTWSVLIFGLAFSFLGACFLSVLALDMLEPELCLVSVLSMLLVSSMIYILLKHRSKG